MITRSLVLLLLLFSLPLLADVSVMRTPEGGIQPQAAVDEAGCVHLIFYKGNERGGDVFYAQMKAGEQAFSKAIRVNSREGSAMAVGSIRGAQLAIGKKHRVHVIWNGGEGALPAQIDGKETTPLVYARMNDAGTAFEPERNLINYAAGLDGGSSIAADPLGNVYAVWHGRSSGAAEGEEGRAVFIARSHDEGKSFEREAPATAAHTGACACCGMRAFADESGALYVLYRGAVEKVNRDEILLVSPKPGAPFEIANRHPWKVEGCPMSSASITSGHNGVLAAWETAGQVFFATAAGNKVGAAHAPLGSVKRKHPVVAQNERGQIFLAWTEGTGWAKGGTVRWQVFAKDGTPEFEQGRAEGLPVWGLATAFAKADGSFVVIY